LPATTIEEAAEAEPPSPAPCTEVVPSSAWFGPGMPASLERELIAFLGAHHGVAIVHWPRDASRVEHLADAGLPRLLLVDPLAGPPPEGGPLQDWLLAPADRQDVHERVARLFRRAAQRHNAACHPRLDDQCRLQAGDGCVQLAVSQRPLAEILLSHFEHPVSHEALLASEAANAPCSFASLQGRLARLCQCINPVRLEVVAVKGNAYMMRWCAG
jgi:hypothetical protein